MANYTHTKDTTHLSNLNLKNIGLPIRPFILYVLFKFLAYLACFFLAYMARFFSIAYMARFFFIAYMARPLEHF